MTKSELLAKMQDAGAWLPGKTVKIDFGGDDGVVFIDGVNSLVSDQDGSADTTIKVSWDDWQSLASGALDGIEQVLVVPGDAPLIAGAPLAELFAAQPRAYRDEVLPPAQARRVSVEAGITMGWREHIGDRFALVGHLERLGVVASAPAPGRFARRETDGGPGTPLPFLVAQVDALLAIAQMPPGHDIDLAAGQHRIAAAQA